MMARIGSKDTKPELVLRKTLHAMGFRYQLHRADLPGKPDLVFPKHQAVCFVHGCFWHRHTGCDFASVPKTRPDFWRIKFKKNTERDRRNISELQSKGWRTAVVWECHLVKHNTNETIESLTSWLIDRADTRPFESHIQNTK